MAMIQDYENTPEGWAQRWKAEMAYSNAKINPWIKKGEEVRKAYLDQRLSEDVPATRLNLFHSNVLTLKSMMYGRVPKVDVDRRYLDPDDDAARVACEIAERVLNVDIEEAAEDFSNVMRNCLENRLLPGFGMCRLKYDFEEQEEQKPALLDDMGTELAPAYIETSIKDEWVDTLYVNWKDNRWSPCRTFTELRWWAFREYLDKDEVIDRFGEEIAKEMNYSAKSPIETETGSHKQEVWSKCEIWEIWDKRTKKVFWWTPEYPKILDAKDDPLNLVGFWPFPPPLVANLTTDEFMPVPDYVIAQDLYREIDKLQERIKNLTEAVKVVGAYDKTAGSSLGQMLKPGTENQMIPVDNWAMFSEKGGVKGVMDFLPLEEVITTLEKLTDVQEAKIEQLYQITGMSDLMRGANTGDSATADAIKAKFGSIRLQALQDEFSRFASDTQRIKLEIIAKVYSPQTLLTASNIQSAPGMQDPANQGLIQAAIELLKSPAHAKWKIQIRPESMAMVDYTQIRQERTEYINALGLFMQSAAPISEKFPQAAPVMLELLKWGMAGFKGSNQIEGILDEAINMIKQSQQQAAQTPPPPDPETIKAQAKAQSDAQNHQQELEKIQMQHQSSMTQLSAKFQADQQKQQEQTQAKLSEMQANFAMELEKIHKKMGAELVVGAQQHASSSSLAAQATEDKIAHRLAQHEVLTGMPQQDGA